MKRVSDHVKGQEAGLMKSLSKERETVGGGREEGGKEAKDLKESPKQRLIT